MRSIKWCHFQWPWTNPNPTWNYSGCWRTLYLCLPCDHNVDTA